nr:Hpt domain-containing protein [Burkholderia glumae]
MSQDDDLSRQSLLELYQEETQTQTEALSRQLLALEHGAQDAAAFEACMRAAHSLKGAARIVGVPQGVEIAGRMEDCFVGAQRGERVLGASHIDALLMGVDLLVRVGDPRRAASVTPIEIDAFAVALAHADGAGDAGRAAPDAAAPLPPGFASGAVSALSADAAGSADFPALADLSALLRLDAPGAGRPTQPACRADRWPPAPGRARPKRRGRPIWPPSCGWPPTRRRPRGRRHRRHRRPRRRRRPSRAATPARCAACAPTA